MARYVLLRLMQLLPVLFLASVGMWLMIYLIPGDPTIALLGADVTPEQLARARTLMGLDRPFRSSTRSGSAGSSGATSGSRT